MRTFALFLILFFFSFKTAVAETLKIECTVKYIDEKKALYKIGDKTIWTYDLKSKKFLFSDDFIRQYNLIKIEDKYYAQYTRIFRYTGEFLQKTVEVPETEIQNLLTHDFNNQTPEVFEKMFFLINTHFPKNKKSKKLYWQEYRKNCVKAQKRF
ncbi:hypothetical protein [Candidatus Pelagibacter sp.]|uniref:hypothetical protein n=1 Tax=Candidatus Pelagibacter sp. TaxID=2024849 RepID=UPI003F8604A8